MAAATHIKTLALGARQVPALCIGTWSWGDSGTWSYKDSDFEHIQGAWDGCNAEGLTFYDTAAIYGNGQSESNIGKLLKGMDEKEREKIIIATKWLPVPSPVGWNILTPGLLASCRRSLARLGVDQVELFQIHGIIGWHSFASQARELAQCVKLGLAKQVGVSNFNTQELIKFHALMEKEGVPIVSNQIEYSLLRTLPDKSGLLAAMKERNIVCLAYSPLAQGRLTGKYSASNPPPSGRKFSNMPMDKIEPVLAAMRPIAEKYGVGPGLSAVALNWVIAKGAIPLGGARNKEQASQNAKALTFTMTPEEIAQLDAVAIEGKTSFWQHG